jgi:hypothetical protein
MAELPKSAPGLKDVSRELTETIAPFLTIVNVDTTFLFFN